MLALQHIFSFYSVFVFFFLEYLWKIVLFCVFYRDGIYNQCYEQFNAFTKSATTFLNVRVAFLENLANVAIFHKRRISIFSRLVLHCTK